MARPPELLYAVDETPPAGVLVFSAIQHVAVIAITIVFPLILGREAGMTGGQFLNLVSLSMLAVGVSTVILCLHSKYVGSGYLCPGCFSAIFLGPSLFAIQRGGVALAFGMTMVAGVAQVAIAPLLHRLRAMMPSEIAGLIIAIVGLALAALGVRYMLGITDKGDIQVNYLVISALSLAVMSALNIWAKGYAKMFCVLIGIGVGYAASAYFRLLDFAQVVPREGLALVQLPSFRHIGYAFDPIVLVPFVVAAFASTLRAMGDITNCQRLNDKDWVRPDLQSLAGGVAANGWATIFCGLVGSCGSNTYSSSVGLSAATGVTSRQVGYVIGAIFILLAFFPAGAALFAAMPPPVMGASLFFTAAFVFISGIQMITTRMLDARKTLVIGFSFAMAVVADIYHTTFMSAPAVIQPIVGHSLVLGTVCAVLLNMITRFGVRQRVVLKLPEVGNNRGAVEQFLSENGARWAARRDVIQRAVFGAVQSLEAIGDSIKDGEIEASFDEFNLDVRIRYAGTPLTIPEQRPTPRQVLASDEGERLLAGYLLRRNADRISSGAFDGRAEVHLHYDH
jgi:xanthine permease XanP